MKFVPLKLAQLPETEMSADIPLALQAESVDGPVGRQTAD